MEDVPDEVLRLYLGLCAEAGPVYQQVRERERAVEVEHTVARSSTAETHPRSLHPMQVERLHLLESELAKHQAGMPTLNATLQAHKSELFFLRPLLRGLNVLRLEKVRLWSRWTPVWGRKGRGEAK